MTEASQVAAAAAAPTGRSLVDDMSTTNHTASSTLATEDTFTPLRHESDHMFPQRPSEHSRLLTDDDQSFNTWSTKRDQRLGYYGGGGSSSVNTGSTYEETPFLPRVEESPQPLPQVPEQQAMESPSEPHDEGAEEATDTIKLVQSDDSRGNEDDGYACEMIFETQAMLQQAKEKASSCFADLFRKESKQRDQPEASDVALATVNGVLGAASDGVDRVLIKLFDVPNADVDASPKYAVSVNDSLTNDYRYVFDAAVKSTSYPKRSRHSRHKKQIQPESSISSSSRSSDNEARPETFLVPVLDESKSLDEIPEEKEAVQDDTVLDEQSDIRDDLDEVLSESYAPTIKQTDTHDSVAKFKESLYADLVDHRESNSTASSIVSDAKREKKAATQDKNESDTESVAKVLDKYLQGSSLAPRSFIQKKQPDFVDLVEEKELVENGQSPDDDVSFSALHKRHVVDLINKNITSTNRSNFVDLSSIDAAMEDQDRSESTLTTEIAGSKAHSDAVQTAGRSWHTSTVAKSTFVETTQSTEHSWHNSSFAEVEEIDKTLNMRREKLRKMMNDLNVSLSKAEDAIVAERREGKVNTQRDEQIEERTILVLETSSHASPRPPSPFKPIDLTLYDECF